MVDIWGDPWVRQSEFSAAPSWGFFRPCGAWSIVPAVFPGLAPWAKFWRFLREPSTYAACVSAFNCSAW